MQARLTDYGFGDEQTWGPCNGHPADPRTPFDGDDCDIQVEGAITVLPPEYRDDDDYFD